jgi:IS30 family transposase
MTSITDLDPTIQITIKYFSNSKTSFQKIADLQGVSKATICRTVQKGIEFLKTYSGQVPKTFEPQTHFQEENKKLQSLVNDLRQQLITKSVNFYLLDALLKKARQFFPKLKLNRLKWFQKKYILEMSLSYQSVGGTLKEFCKSIGKSHKTILQWKKAFEEFGNSGLVDKTTRPKNFGNRLPSYVKAQLLHLFLKFPMWSEYQYHNYIKHNPATHWYVSLPTINKLKEIHRDRAEEEKTRIKKRWAFEKGTDIWTIDFTTILQTGSYKLQALTVSDTRSRFIFDITLFLSTSTNIVCDRLQDLFIQFGKPDVIKADNGPEFRTQCQQNLQDFCVHVFNNPSPFYGQFNGAHERIHKTFKNFISRFKTHQNLSRLAAEIQAFMEQYNHDMKFDYLEGKTPAEVYYNEKDFVPKNVEVVKPYEKEGEIRFKFKNRFGEHARVGIEKIEPHDKTSKFVQRQLEAMGADTFDLGIRDEQTGKMINRKNLSSEEVLNSIKWLKFMNAKGNHIYIRPHGDHGLTLLDDLDDEQVKAVVKAGYKPAVVVLTSPNNNQIWLQHGQILEPQISKLAAKDLAHKFGADLSSADSSHYGRLAGFTNPKPKYLQTNGTAPFCLLICAIDRSYEHAKKYIDKIRGTVTSKKESATTQTITKIAKLRNILDFHKDSRFENDLHRADLAWAIHAVHLGLSQVEVVQEILNSRDLSKKGNTRRQYEYAKRTCEKATKLAG